MGIVFIKLFYYQMIKHFHKESIQLRILPRWRLRRLAADHRSSLCGSLGLAQKTSEKPPGLEKPSGFCWFLLARILFWRWRILLAQFWGETWACYELSSVGRANCAIWRVEQVLICSVVDSDKYNSKKEDHVIPWETWGHNRPSWRLTTNTG